MSQIDKGALKALGGYLKMRPADIEHALVRADEAEEERSGVRHKYVIPNPSERLKAQVASLICDGRTGKLKDWAQELVDGDVRDLAVAILTLACSQLSIVMSVGVPFAALLAKRGLKNICQAARPRKAKRGRAHR